MRVFYLSWETGRKMNRTTCFRPVVEFALCLTITLTFAGCGTRHALGGGIARGSTEVSQTTNTAWGPALSARLWTPEESLGGLVALDLQPFRVQNPQRDEHFRVLYLQPQVQFRPAPFFVRLGLGAPLYSFGGRDPAGGGELGLSFGAGIGMDVGGMHGRDWSVEAFWRTAAEFTGELESDLIGVQLCTYLR